MTAGRYQGNIITKNPTTPTGPYETGAAPGVWSLEEANEFTKAGVWPTAGNLPLNVEDVFSTYLYVGTGDNQTNTVTNGLDLAGEGGMVWTKARDIGYSPIIFDSERGLESFLYSNSTGGETNENARSNMSFNSDGYSFGSVSATSWGPINEGNYNFVSWSFRKASKFFDMQTWTGDGTNGRAINHNLGSVPGCILIKIRDAVDSWTVYHRGINATSPEDYRLRLNTTDAKVDAPVFADTAPTDTTFTLGAYGEVNGNGNEYVAYIFAHNDGDGGFGPNGDQDIIKCGSVVTDGSGNASVDVGFEPQWILWKCADALGGNEHGNWRINDVLRSYPVKDSAATFGYPKTVYANSTGTETINGVDGFLESATGFGFGQVQASKRYVYVAIRRGIKVPTSGTDVFQTQLYTGNGSTQLYNLNITPDMVINISRNINGDARAINDRLRQQAACLELYTDGNGTQYNGGANVGMEMDFTEKVQVQSYRITNSEPYLNYIFKRAPDAFDIVCYTGTGSSQNINHSLGVAPEMMWVKNRSVSANWSVYHKDLPSSGILRLNQDVANQTGDGVYIFGNDSTLIAPTDTVFTVGGADGTSNTSGAYYVIYLFATLAGVTKVGSYTGNGSNQTIDCGFTSGARFVLIKRTDSTGNWYVWDSERGIVAGNDPHLDLNTATVEVTSDDSLDPDSSGFIVNQVSATNVNVSSGTYIFYAIA